MTPQEKLWEIMVHTGIQSVSHNYIINVKASDGDKRFEGGTLDGVVGEAYEYLRGLDKVGEK